MTPAAPGNKDTESQGPAILKYRKHGASDAEIIRHYAPVQGSSL